MTGEDDADVAPDAGRPPAPDPADEAGEPWYAPWGSRGGTVWPRAASGATPGDGDVRPGDADEAVPRPATGHATPADRWAAVGHADDPTPGPAEGETWSPNGVGPGEAGSTVDEGAAWPAAADGATSRTGLPGDEDAWPAASDSATSWTGSADGGAWPAASDMHPGGGPAPTSWNRLSADEADRPAAAGVHPADDEGSPAAEDSATSWTAATDGAERPAADDGPARISWTPLPVDDGAWPTARDVHPAGGHDPDPVPTAWLAPTDEGAWAAADDAPVPTSWAAPGDDTDRPAADDGPAPWPAQTDEGTWPAADDAPAPTSWERLPADEDAWPAADDRRAGGGHENDAATPPWATPDETAAAPVTGAWADAGGTGWSAEDNPWPAAENIDEPGAEDRGADESDADELVAAWPAADEARTGAWPGGADEPAADDARTGAWPGGADEPAADDAPTGAWPGGTDEPVADEAPTGAWPGGTAWPAADAAPAAPAIDAGPASSAASPPAPGSDDPLPSAWRDLPPLPAPAGKGEPATWAHAAHHDDRPGPGGWPGEPSDDRSHLDAPVARLRPHPSAPARPHAVAAPATLPPVPVPHPTAPSLPPPDVPLAPPRAPTPAEPAAGWAPHRGGGTITLAPHDAPPTRADDTPPGAAAPRSATRNAVEWVVIIGAALAAALIIKTYLLQAFYIPSPSMEPTLMIQDRVLVNKLSYRLHDVHRGDVVVFERPPNDVGTIRDLIKRVIGLSGDTVEGRNGEVWINGKPLNEPYLPDGTVTSEFAPKTIPDGYIWVMGDNRSNSSDSRVFGVVDEDRIIGRAFVRVWPLSALGLL